MHAEKLLRWLLVVNTTVGTHCNSWKDDLCPLLWFVFTARLCTPLAAYSCYGKTNVVHRAEQKVCSDISSHFTTHNLSTAVNPSLGKLAYE